jgi:uncharacterized membrane protein (UPF0127 family)
MIEAVPMSRPAIAILAAILVAVACSRQVSPMGFEQAALVVRTESGPVRIRVEVADSPEERARGLMFREDLPPDAGMVFLAEDATSGGFWMKNTRIPLSIAFWDRQQRILAILDMEPCREDPCPVYYPGVSWIAALEVNQGFFDRRGVEVGDRVLLER